MSSFADKHHMKDLENALERPELTTPALLAPATAPRPLWVRMENTYPFLKNNPVIPDSIVLTETNSDNYTATGSDLLALYKSTLKTALIAAISRSINCQTLLSLAFQRTSWLDWFYTDVPLATFNSQGDPQRLLFIKANPRKPPRRVWQVLEIVKLRWPAVSAGVIYMVSDRVNPAQQNGRLLEITSLATLTETLKETHPPEEVKLWYIPESEVADYAQSAGIIDPKNRTAAMKVWKLAISKRTRN